MMERDEQTASAGLQRAGLACEGLPSLLIEQETRAAEQPALFSLPEMVEEGLNVEGLYTAARLFLQRPDTYRSIVELLKQGTGIRAIKKVCRVHHRTITAVSERERVAIDTGKEKLVADLRFASSVLAESLIEDVLENRLKPEAKPVALGILIDKTELLSGGVTARVETIQTEGAATWDEWKAKALKVAKGHVITGSGVEENEQREPARVHLLNRAPAQTSDLVSDASQREPASATASATDEPLPSDPPAPIDEGGRGSAFQAGGAGATTD